MTRKPRERDKQMSDIEFETTVDLNGNDVDIFVNIDTDDVISALENDGYMIYSEESPLDELLGSIESTTIITHLESSIEAMVIRKLEEPTNELCEVFLTYLDDFNWRSTFIKLMRRHGIMLETILRAYIDDEKSEEAEHELY